MILCGPWIGRRGSAGGGGGGGDPPITATVVWDSTTVDLNSGTPYANLDIDLSEAVQRRIFVEIFDATQFTATDFVFALGQWEIQPAPNDFGTLHQPGALPDARWRAIFLTDAAGRLRLRYVPESGGDNLIYVQVMGDRGGSAYEERISVTT